MLPLPNEVRARDQAEMKNIYEKLYASFNDGWDRDLSVAELLRSLFAVDDAVNSRPLNGPMVGRINRKTQKACSTIHDQVCKVICTGHDPSTHREMRKVLSGA